MHERVGLRWLRGSGAVGIYNLMEDAATAEIARSQVWQWVHQGVRLSGGSLVTRELVEGLLDRELELLRETLGEQAFRSGHWEDAREIFTTTALSDDFADFLTLVAYERMP